MRINITFYFLLVYFSAKSQNALNFTINIESSNFYQGKPFVISTTIKNISNDTIKLVRPWSDLSASSLYKPMLQVKKYDEPEWKTIPYSDYISNEIIHCGDGNNTDFEELLPNNSLSSNLVYSTYFCQNLRKARANNFFKLIFDTPGTYSLRLLFVNQIGWKDAKFREKINFSNNSNIIYSNDIVIEVHQLSKIDKRAINWLKKHNVENFSYLFFPTISDPLIGNYSNIEDVILEKFIKLFPKSNFVSYARLQLVYNLLKKSENLQTNIGIKKIGNLLNFDSKDNILLQEQKRNYARYINLIEKQQNKNNENKN